MRVIKRLHLFMLQTFLPLFAMTFFIVLFIVLMQFLWKYIDDLVGKGLSMDVLGELFFYAAVSMVPMALPLAILLASLMTFGNLGEKFELTAMKASGISLIRVMAPLIILVSAISVGAFFFQNDVLPKAQVKMWTLLFSMRQKSPEVEIPQGVFYDQIPGYSLFVKHKDQNTGLLYGVMIYDVKEGGDNSTILMADSAQMAFTPDNRYLFLHMYYGEQFENLREQRSLDQNVPFRRETFEDKEILIPFDANFNRLDEGGMRKQYVGKNIAELHQTIDSIAQKVDSIGDEYSKMLSEEMKVRFGSVPTQANKAPIAMKMKPLDSLLNADEMTARTMIYEQAANQARNTAQTYEYKSASFDDEKRTMRRNEIELIKKYTLSVACLIMFFIGAPLGAIIRKGGIGTPLVISVFLFLFYYIIDNTGYKMARDGRWNVEFGIWLSTLVLAPLGVYVTYKAMNDSDLFDKDAWMRFIRRFIPERGARKIEYKEVIFNEISKPVALQRVSTLREYCEQFLAANSRPQSYPHYFETGYNRRAIRSIYETLEGTIDYLRNSSDKKVIGILQQLPYARPSRLLSPSHNKYLSLVLMTVFPIGLPLWLIGLKKQRDYKRTLRDILTRTEPLLTLLSD